MGEFLKIQNLEDLIASNLENGEKISGTKMLPLTAPGENYASIMLRIDISIKNENTGIERTLNTVAKLVPESEKIQAVFNTPVTFRNEIKFYSEIVPIFDTLLKRKGILSGTDFIAPFFGGRLNLNGSDVVNAEAIILLKNLKSEGYIMGKKSEGLDLETSKLVLNSLAKLHAAGIALKYYEPQTFEEKLKPCFYCFTPEDYLYDMVLNKVVDKLNNNGYSADEINAVAGYKNRNLQKTKYVNDMWGTIVHYDSWTNNFLIKYEDNKPEHAVMVDFQVFDYKSPLNDVMFFLFVSVQPDIFEDSIDPLLEFYYNQLIDNLKALGVDMRLFTIQSFDEEVILAVKNYEYAHALWMLYVIMNESLKSVEDLPLQISKDWSEKHVQRILQLTRICFKRGWLRAK